MLHAHGFNSVPYTDCLLYGLQYGTVCMFMAKCQQLLKRQFFVSWLFTIMVCLHFSFCSCYKILTTTTATKMCTKRGDEVKNDLKVNKKILKNQVSFLCFHFKNILLIKFQYFFPLKSNQWFFSTSFFDYKICDYKQGQENLYIFFLIWFFIGKTF